MRSSKPRRRLRKQLKAFRKRMMKPRKAVQELDDDIESVAIGQPKEGE